MARYSIEQSTARTVTLDGRELLLFGGTNYLGLAHHPEVVGAARRALDGNGISSGGSRETTGGRLEHARLEAALAEFIGTDAAALTADGYLADLAALQSLGDTVSVGLLDGSAHPSLTDAARACGLRLLRYEQDDLSPLSDCRGDRVCVLTDSVFPMEGRLAPLPELLSRLPGDGALIVDDSHGLGVLGAGGRGVLEATGLKDERILVTASLAKSLGCFGGVVAGTRDRIERLRSVAAYVGTTPIPSALAAATEASLRVLIREPERVRRLHTNATRLQSMAPRVGGTGRSSFPPVLTLEPSDRESGERIQHAMMRQGLLVPFIDYPGAPATGAFRVAVTSEHTVLDLNRLEQALLEHLSPPEEA